MWSRSPDCASENAWEAVELHLGELWEQELANFEKKKSYKARRQEKEPVNMIKQLLG